MENNLFLDMFLNWTPIAGLVVLLAILCIVVMALIKTYGYFIERFPREEDEEHRYLSNKFKADQEQIRLDELQKTIQQVRQQVIDETNALRQKIIDEQQLNTVSADLETTQRKLDSANELLHVSTKEKLEAEQQVEMLRAKVESLTNDKNILEKKIEEAKEILAGLNNSDLERLKKAYEEVTRKLYQAKSDLEQIEIRINQRKEEEKKLPVYSEKVNKLKGQVEELENRKTTTQNELSSKQKDFAQLKMDIDAATARLAVLEQNKKKIEEDIRGLEHQVTSQEEIDKKYGSLYEIPETLRNYIDLQTSKFSSESEELDKFHDWLRDRGIRFSKRIVKAFHTSLKTQRSNPLTVLAGISGTGKTLLPVKYADYFGIHKLVLPVQPRWDSHQDLIGFYNYLEKRYQATELAQSLVAFEGAHHKDRGLERRFKDGMMMVLMDEMNLARTEYYFSEFLSKLEMRRLVDTKARDSESETKDNAKIVIDGTFGKVWVPENVLFVGTMNEDESTQTLSDKVLDRANVLRFGKPKDLSKDLQDNYIDQTISLHDRISFNDQWKEWMVDPEEFKAAHPDFYADARRKIEELNESLQTVGKPFGYRVSDSIIDYISNYPCDNDEQGFKDAFADQIEQKIFPKLRGLDLQQESVDRCLHRILEVVEELDNEMGELFRTAADSSRNEMFMWKGMSRED